MNSENKSKKDSATATSVDISQLVGPLTAALAPQITQIIETEFKRREAYIAYTGPSKSASGQGTDEIHADSNQNKNSASGHGTDEIHADSDEQGTNHKRRLDSDMSDGEATDDENIMDPLDAFAENSLSWKAPKETARYLEAYMRRSLTKDERKAILNAYPRPSEASTSMPRVDEPFSNLLKQQGVQLKLVKTR